MKPDIKKRTTRQMSINMKRKRTNPKSSSRYPLSKSSSSLRTKRYWRNWGFRAGQEDARIHSIANEPYHMKALNTLWYKCTKSNLPSPYSRSYHAASKGYVEGYCKASRMHVSDWVLMPTLRSVGAIVSVMNEEEMIVKVLGQLNRLPLDEIIIIVNGSNDNTLEKVRMHSHALIVNYPEPLGHDVGRAIGAKLSQSDILLFLDGDFVVQAEDLVPFIHDIDQGSDLALNNISPYLPSFSKWDSVTVMKRFLNLSLNRSDLNANSLTAVPHAIARNALLQIGISELMIPPKAQANAILSGLRITAPKSINVVSFNKIRKHNKGRDNPVARMIVGDHVEALQYAMQSKGKRIVFPDTIRQRKFLLRGKEHAGN